MQTHIVQMIALTLRGNAYLQGGDLARFWPETKVFTFCKSVRFVTLDVAQTPAIETPCAEDPVQWMQQLQQQGVRGLRLLHRSRNDPRISDRMSVGFVGGGGRWMIEVVKADTSDAWEARWEIGDKDDPERRIWNVTYGRTVTDQPILDPPAVRDRTLREHLASVLTDIAHFADAHKLDNFATCFRRGLAALDADPPQLMAYDDLVPAGVLPLERQQLLAACLGGWVFGAMGSWNDLGFQGEDQKTYESLSDRLFQLLNQAALQATNASFKPVLKPKPVASVPWWRKAWGAGS